MARAVGGFLVVTGSIALLWATTVWAYGLYERVERAHELPNATATWTPARGDTLGLIEIPRLQLSVVVVEGDDEQSLRSGVGHLTDTPLPWGVGNSVLAGHRDTDFRPLKRIRSGDTVRFRMGNRAIEYVVRDTRVVNDTSLDVLQPTETPTLTLITCYPFGYLGPAPKRFIVRAERKYRADWPVAALAGSADGR